MPAFMAVSGYLAFRKNKKSDYGQIIKRRFFQLIIPFLVWTTLLILTSSTLSLSSIKTYLLYPDKGLWFLWVLFFIYVLFVSGSWLADHLMVKQEIIIVIICLLLAVIMVVFEPRLFGFQFIAYYFLFYSLGYYLHKYSDRIITKNLIIISVLTLCWFILAWFWKMHELPSWLSFTILPTSLLQYTYRFITAAIAVYVLLAISPLALNGDKWYNNPIVNLGAVSLGIYTTHYILIGRIIQLFSDFGLSTSMNTIVSFVVTLLVSWVIVWLLSNWRLTRMFMLGKI